MDELLKGSLFCLILPILVVDMVVVRISIKLIREQLQESYKSGRKTVFFVQLLIVFVFFFFIVVYPIIYFLTL